MSRVPTDSALSAHEKGGHLNIRYRGGSCHICLIEPEHADDRRISAYQAQTILAATGRVTRQCLQSGSEVIPQQHGESSAPGELFCQDVFYWGTLKDVGKVYVQGVIDTFCSLAFAKVYTSKMPVTAADTLFDRVLPFCEAIGVPVQAILTDNGREFCGKPEQHPPNCCWQ